MPDLTCFFEEQPLQAQDYLNNLSVLSQATCVDPEAMACAANSSTSTTTDFGMPSPGIDMHSLDIDFDFLANPSPEAIPSHISAPLQALACSSEPALEIKSHIEGTSQSHGGPVKGSNSLLKSHDAKLTRRALHPDLPFAEAGPESLHLPPDEDGLGGVPSVSGFQSGTGSALSDDMDTKITEGDDVLFECMNYIMAETGSAGAEGDDGSES
eukprot:scaffold478254_cov48-Prasinocladus_malaysianus.AAC.1